MKFGSIVNSQKCLGQGEISNGKFIKERYFPQKREFREEKKLTL